MTKSVLPKLHFPLGVQEGSAERGDHHHHHHVSCIMNVSCTQGGSAERGDAFSFRFLDYSILDFRF